MTRALACLIAGRVGEAVECNALSMVLAPVAVGFGVVEGFWVLRWNCWLEVRVPIGWVAPACAGVVAFGVGRNLSL
jgi:hypothetical protein